MVTVTAAAPQWLRTTSTVTPIARQRRRRAARIATGLILEHAMTQPKQQIDPAVKGRPFLEEADIGSGEKTPAQVETEEMIRQIPPLPPTGREAESGGAARQSGHDEEPQPDKR
jgi:hypothetical protein